jgi:Amt family ammonium transporter
MKMKQFLLWLLLLLSFFSDISIAEQNKSITSEFNKQKKIPHAIDVSPPQNKIHNNNRKVQNLYEQIDSINTNIKKNEMSINHINRVINGINRSLSVTGKIIAADHKKISDIAESDRPNEKLMSERMLTSDSYKSDIEKIYQKLDNLHETSGLPSNYLDRFWVIISAALVFIMLAGFMTYESGMVRKGQENNVAVKNVLNLLLFSLFFFIFGFGLMYGESFFGLLGTNLFAPTMEVMQNVKDSIENQYLGIEFFLYQLVLAATTVTIVSRALSERIALVPYILLIAFIGIFIYPLFGHWAWGGSYFQSDQGWLYAIGFRDFAGATVVHSIGAWIGLAGVMVIGPRIGRYDRYGNVNNLDFMPTNLSYSALGVFILWFGFWGFNGGSELNYDENVASIILNINISGSAAGISAFFHALYQSRDKYEIFPKLLGGILGGLVAITASCNSVSAWEAAFIGAAAGLIYNFSHDYLMNKLKFDDPVGAISIHGACGVWGTLCVALFAQLDADFFSQNGDVLFAEHGLLADIKIRIMQFIIQLVGILTAFLFAFPASYLFFSRIRKIPGIGLRVMPADEKSGAILGISY